jgi:hypothetical protein
MLPFRAQVGIRAAGFQSLMGSFQSSKEQFKLSHELSSLHYDHNLL